MSKARDLSNLIGSGNYSQTTLTATAGQTSFTVSHTPNFVQVFMNGLLLDPTVDFTANGTAIVLTEAAAVGDELEVVTYETFSVGDAITQTAADTRYVLDTADVITVSGSNVGIGESDPDTSLDVVGGSADSVIDTLTLKNDSTGTSAGIGINFVVDGNNDVTTAAIYGQRTGSAYHQGSLQFLTTDGSGGGLTERMRIDSSGRVTMPYQPAFCAYKSAVSNTSYGAGNIVSADMTSTKYNVGGHYNTSNGRFTAPISGLYLFWCSLFNNTASVARLRCDINGGAGAWGQGQSAAYSDWAITGVAKLNAGDYVHLTSAYAGTTVFHDINHSSWGGYLIG
jgi:hypothetical protein